MKKQWKKFVNDNRSCFSYGVVLTLVKRLDKAIKSGNKALIDDLLDALALQGVILDMNGNLRFLMDGLLGWDI
jgi:hypothetical protein